MRITSEKSHLIRAPEDIHQNLVGQKLPASADELLLPYRDAGRLGYDLLDRSDCGSWVHRDRAHEAAKADDAQRLYLEAHMACRLDVWLWSWEGRHRFEKRHGQEPQNGAAYLDAFEPNLQE